MKTSIVVILVSIACTCAFAQTQLSVQPQTVTAGTLDTINISVNLAGIEGVFASSMTIEFDPSVVRVVGWQRGTLLESNPAGNPVHYEAIYQPNSPADSVRVDQVIMGSSSASGNGELFRLLLVPVGSGESAIQFRSARLRAIDNTPIPMTSIPGSITIDFARVRVKAFLEGALTENGMTPGRPGTLPLSQPYAGQPWNYHGQERLPDNFYTAHTNIVDWVLVELWYASAACATLGRKAGLLTTSGEIVDIDGFSPLQVPVPNKQSYYIVVRHRNHLPVISTQAVWIDSPRSPEYDFTSSMSQAMGNEPMKPSADGVFTLYAGDANSDGIINGTDFNIYFAQFNSISSGYTMPDFNLDGQVTGSDFNFFFSNFVNIRKSNVPE